MNKEIPESARLQGWQIEELAFKINPTVSDICSIVVKTAEDNAWIAFLEWILTNDGVRLSSLLNYEAGEQQMMLTVLEVINKQTEYQTMSGEKEGPDAEIMIDKSNLMSALANYKP